MEPSPAQRAARDQIAAQLAQAGFALPGTLTVRAYACGKPGCRCHADPPRLHGPYAEWTRKIGGKTITRRLNPAELAEYQPLFDNAKKLRTLLSELQDLTLQVIETDSTREPSTPAEPEPHTPENVGEARLTCGQPSSQTPFAQASPKREDLAHFMPLTWASVPGSSSRGLLGRASVVLACVDHGSGELLAGRDAAGTWYGPGVGAQRRFL